MRQYATPSPGIVIFYLWNGCWCSKLVKEGTVLFYVIGFKRKKKNPVQLVHTSKVNQAVGRKREPSRLAGIIPAWLGACWEWGLTVEGVWVMGTLYDSNGGKLPALGAQKLWGFELLFIGCVTVISSLGGSISACCWSLRRHIKFVTAPHDL